MEREGGKGGEAGEARGGKGYGLVKDVWLSLKWGKVWEKITTAPQAFFQTMFFPYLSFFLSFFLSFSFSSSTIEANRQYIKT